MSRDPSSWQSLPTIVELTDSGRAKQQAAARIADLLDDVIVAPENNRASGDASVDRTGWSVERLVRDFSLGGEEVPMLVRAAAPLLNLSHEIRKTDAQPDIDELRRVSFEVVNRYERDLGAARISPERARAAHYIICATLDDVVLSKPWGVTAGWARSGLVSTFHMDVTGGERVFDLLDHFHQTPGSAKDILLLIYLSLSLAFEGRMRVSARGNLELSRIRDGLYKTLLGQYGIFERELSPHWRGVSARHRPLKTATALWTLLSVVALIFALGYLFFTLSLNGISDGTFTRLAGLPPSETPSVVMTTPPLPTPPAEDPAPIAVAPPPVIPELPPRKPDPVPIEELLAFLQPEVDKKLVTLSDAEGRLRIRINNSGLFETGSAEVSPLFRDLLERIGAALAADRFRAVVVGYTDNVPIKTVQFPSNWHLSEARAKAVGEILGAYTGTEAILTEGRADSDPIASNDTPEGREMNRRTEVLVLTDPRQHLGGQDIAPPVVEASEPAEPSTGSQP
ncbi:type VI secretion system protein TssL, long form [Rhizobium sp. AAP43]|uniref:type VI secretion system protein TssL, long form n=1 Tax=Rhizobium sp. AAP43 TaxID=1523420 RepID=UPI0006B96082|nr:type VI secretion system protein TssL, long form [Rhizobium sp. AAP43]KPF45778.1 cell envelope biogenesis protein OmpA [Rhizobium sp. AAP43]